MTPFQKEALSFLFYKEEISGRLMHLNHLLVEKKVKSQGLSPNYHTQTDVLDLIDI